MELLHFLVDFVLHLDRHLVDLLTRFDVWLYAILFLVIFAETLGKLAPHAQLLADAPVVFTVNLSGQSLGEAQFVDYLLAQIKGSGVNPRVLCFELTESEAIANLDRAEELMQRLREVGCSVALDDFGTGLSSLAYLRKLPVDMLKIDGSFVRDVLKDPSAESMVQAIAQLAH